MNRAGALLRAVAAAGLAAALPPSAVAAGLADAPPGASSCSGCHALRAARASLPAIHGRPADEIAAALAAFRAGTRPATVMNRIALGFSPDESRAIAVWLSHQAAPK